MKKILSVILSVMFLNLTLCPAVIAEDIVQPSDEAGVITNSDASAVAEPSTAAQSSDAGVSSTPVASVPTQEPEICTQPMNYDQQNGGKTEHLSIRKDKSRKISLESVYITSHGVELPASDILQIAFINDFNGRKAHVGDKIAFRFPNDIVTQEGTMIIPSSAKIVAEITQLKKPKLLHLSGKVYLSFKYIEINGVKKPIDARIYGKKDYLSRKTMNKTKAVGETAVTTGAGAAAGAIICASTATNAAVIIFGSAISAGVGAVAGVAVGILLPGASFRAKAGQKVNIVLTDELDI